MLALKNKDHVVEGSLPGLADMARVSVDDCMSALEKLMAPDPHSRTADFDGRRIQKIPGGWYIVNGEKYRRLMSMDERREYNRLKKQESRAKQKDEQKPPKKPKTGQNPVSTLFDKSAVSAQSDTDTEEEPLPSTPNPPKGGFPVLPDELSAVDEMRVAWLDFLADRKARKCPVTPLSAKRIIKKLEGWGVSKSIVALDMAIERAWKGVFDPDEACRNGSKEVNRRNVGTHETGVNYAEEVRKRTLKQQEQVGRKVVGNENRPPQSSEAT